MGPFWWIRKVYIYFELFIIIAILFVEYNVSRFNIDTQGKEVELEMKSAGHGEATFIFADMLVEPDVQVSIISTISYTKKAKIHRSLVFLILIKKSVHFKFTTI